MRATAKATTKRKFSSGSGARRAWLAIVGALALGAATEGTAEAAAPWVERRLTLPRHVWAFDMGLGVARYDRGPNNRGAEPGFNFEVAVSPVRHLDLGLRTGFRPLDDRSTKADEFGRLFDRQTHTGNRLGRFVNPEFRVRGEVVDTEVFELALEGRVYLPVEPPDALFATVLGLPMGIHLGSIARFETGVYMPIDVDNGNTSFQFSVPFDVWFQVTPKLWLGPMTNLRYVQPAGPNNDRTDFGVGFGLGYQFASFVDLKTQLFWPAINQDPGAGNFGVGVGVQLRIE